MLPLDDHPEALRRAGWPDAALPARTRALATLRGWLATGRVEPATLPTPDELAPLLAVCQSEAPAAAEAAHLLALLQTGRWLAAASALTDRPLAAPAAVQDNGNNGEQSG